MASVNFLEEALSTDVDESAVSAIVGSLETQLVSSSGAAMATSVATAAVNHVPCVAGGALKPSLANGETSNGGQGQQDLKPPPGLNADTVSVAPLQPTGAVKIALYQAPQTCNGLPPSTTAAAKSNPTALVLKAAPASNNGSDTTPSLVTLPVNVPPINNMVNVRHKGSTTLNSHNQHHQTHAQQTRVVLSAAPHIVGGRPGAPLTIQSFHGLQPGQQGTLLLKTENGQYQLLRVGPPPPTNLAGAGTQNAAPNITFRMQTVPATAAAATVVSVTSPAMAGATTTISTPSTVTQQIVQKAASDNTKEKCRKFLANLLELSSKEPKAVEKSVRTLIQELIDMKVEPEDFCDKLERLLNASPQPCLIGFLKKSLPLLRHALVTKEMSIDGIRPPPAHVVFSIAGPSTTTTTALRPVVAPMAGQQQMRIVAPAAVVNTTNAGATVMRPTHVVQHRLGTPAALRSVQPAATNVMAAAAVPQHTPRMVRGLTTAAAGTTVPVRQPLQIRTVLPSSQVRQLAPLSSNTAINPPNSNSVRLTNNNAVLGLNQVTASGGGGTKTSLSVVHKVNNSTVSSNLSKQQQPAVPSLPSSGGSKVSVKDREKKSGSAGGATAFMAASAAAGAAAAAASAGYAGGDDDINDVAAMGGVNLAEESQRILGSTEFVGTQIRSCKEELICSMSALQQRIRQTGNKHGLDMDACPHVADLAACISHAAHEQLKNLLEKLAVITDHRLDTIKGDPRYEVVSDVKGQLKFLEELDRAERKRHEESEREMLLRAAKSRSKTEDPEQAKLRAKAKEMQRVEMEELRQREANATALQAIGPRKKPRLDGEMFAIPGAPQSHSSSVGSMSNTNRSQVPVRQRIKKVSLRDIQFLFETDRDLCKSKLLYKSYLK